jgi:hypothetical protein
MERIEQIEPNKDIIRMTEKILEQNQVILDMNARLLAVFQSPALVIRSDKD